MKNDGLMAMTKKLVAKPSMSAAKAVAAKKRGKSKKSKMKMGY